RLLPQLRRTPGNTEREVHAPFVPRVGQRFERIDVRSRARRAEELGSELRRRRGEDLDRHAFDGHAECAARVALDHGDDRRQPLEPIEYLLWSRRRHDDREVERDVRPTSCIAGGLAVEAGRDLLDERACPVEREPALMRTLLSFERREQPLLGLRPDARDALQPSGACRLAKLVRGSHAPPPPPPPPPLPPP